MHSFAASRRAGIGIRRAGAGRQEDSATGRNLINGWLRDGARSEPIYRMQQKMLGRLGSRRIGGDADPEEPAAFKLDNQPLSSADESDFEAIGQFDEQLFAVPQVKCAAELIAYRVGSGAAVEQRTATDISEIQIR